MPLYFPDILEHNNQDNPLMNASSLKGGAVSVASIAARNAIPINKRVIGHLVSVLGSTKRYDGADVSEPNWINTANWVDVGGTVTYTNSDATLVTLGGIKAGSTFNAQTMKQMWDALLYPTLYPALGNPYNTFSLSQNGSNLEVGSVLASLNFRADFNRGSISPAYGTSGFRTGLPSSYNYTGFGLTNTVNPAGLPLFDNKTINNYKILSGINAWGNTVTWIKGDQPKDSSGAPFDHAYYPPDYPDTTGNVGVSINGIYPVFYGKSFTKPVASQALINDAATVKDVTLSEGTVSITFDAASQYIWFAIPYTSTNDKHKWFTPSNNVTGNIGVEASDLFADDVLLTINSPQLPTPFWTGIQYRIYISNFTTGTTGPMQLKNS